MGFDLLPPLCFERVTYKIIISPRLFKLVCNNSLKLRLAKFCNQLGFARR